MGSGIHGAESTIQNGFRFTYMGRPVTTLNNEETTRTISSKLESEKSRQSLCRPAILSNHQRKSLRLIVRIGPLQLAIHVVQNRRAGEQKSHWDKKNKESYHLKLCMFFVCLVPVRLLLSSTAVLYHVNG